MYIYLLSTSKSSSYCPTYHFIRGNLDTSYSSYFLFFFHNSLFVSDWWCGLHVVANILVRKTLFVQSTLFSFYDSLLYIWSYGCLPSGKTMDASKMDVPGCFPMSSTNRKPSTNNIPYEDLFQWITPSLSSFATSSSLQR